MNAEITNAVASADDKAQYDEQAKKLLAQKIILAHILVKTVEEFKGMDPKEVVSYIEGEPYVGVVPLESGLTNVESYDAKGQKIVGLNTENSEINEGLVRFDIIFYVRMKDGLTQIIVNVETQKDEPSAYNILNRAIFYVSRMISSQKERDFVNSNYDDIKQVVSIWICMNMESNNMCHIHLVKDDVLDSYAWKGNLDLLNIVMIGITNDLPEQDERNELHRLLTALLSNVIETSKKLNIIEKEYDIPISDSFRKDVNSMCNLSQGIEDRVTIEFIMNMYKNNISIEQIAVIANKSTDEIKAIIEKHQPVVV